MFQDIPTMDDFDFKGKTALVRIDVNSPIDPKTGDILDDRRFKSHKETINELIEKKAKIVLIAHQGRPGDADFTTLEEHARWLSDVAGKKVRYVDSIFSSYAGSEIKKLEEGEILLLENVRFHSEEVITRPPDAQAKTFIVQKLKDVVDIYVDDAFATAHRSQPTIVGFPMVIQSVAGRLMQKELNSIGKIMRNPKKPITFILGGTKVDDSLSIARKAIENGTDKILTGGVVANVFLAAKGYRIGEPSIEFIRGKKMTDQIDVAKELLDKYGDNIILPIDLVLEHYGEKMEISVSDLPENFRISDIGRGTVDMYRDIIMNSGTVFANGALGIFEDKKFAYGTEETIKSIAASKAFSVIGGGHTVAAARNLKLEGEINHISSGGSACVNLLAGYKLPAVEALTENKIRYQQK